MRRRSRISGPCWAGSTTSTLWNCASSSCAFRGQSPIRRPGRTGPASFTAQRPASRPGCSYPTARPRSGAPGTRSGTACRRARVLSAGVGVPNVHREELQEPSARVLSGFGDDRRSRELLHVDPGRRNAPASAPRVIALGRGAGSKRSVGLISEVSWLLGRHSSTGPSPRDLD